MPPPFCDYGKDAEIMQALELFYQRIHGDYDGTLRRIPSEQILLKYVRLYAQEPTCARLQEALMSQRWEDAFREAHSLKGVAQTLGFTHLYEVCSVLADALRPGRPLLDVSLWDNVQRAHLEVLDALSLLTNPE